MAPKALPKKRPENDDNNKKEGEESKLHNDDEKKMKKIEKENKDPEDVQTDEATALAPLGQQECVGWGR